MLFSTWRPESYWEIVGLHGWVACLTGLPVILAYLVPPRNLPLMPCMFRRLTGIPCPFCGFTRAFRAMALGDWGAAFTDCPLGAALFLALLLMTAWHGAAAVLGVRIVRGRLLLLKPRQTRLLIVACGFLLAANWAYRVFMTVLFVD